MSFSVDEKFIAQAESELRVRFPAALRDRLARENGGEVLADGDAWELHPVFDTSDRKRTARTANHIVRETSAAKSWRGFPDRAIAIAGNGTGDRLILMDHAVFLWDHETGNVTQLEETLDRLFA